MKEAQEPVRITKHNESTSQGVDKLEEEMKKLKEIKKKHEYEVKSLNSNIEKINKKEEEIRKDLKLSQDEDRHIQSEKISTEKFKRNLEVRNKEMIKENNDILDEITDSKARKKKVELEIKQAKKKYNEHF